MARPHGGRAAAASGRGAVLWVGALKSELGYTGGLKLSGTLLHLRARVYDSGTRRFLQADVVDMLRYAYVGGDPANYIDPSGREAKHSSIAGGAGATQATIDGGPPGAEVNGFRCFASSEGQVCEGPPGATEEDFQATLPEEYMNGPRYPEALVHTGVPLQQRAEAELTRRMLGVDRPTADGQRRAFSLRRAWEGFRSQWTYAYNSTTAFPTQSVGWLAEKALGASPPEGRSAYVEWGLAFAAGKTSSFMNGKALAGMGAPSIVKILENGIVNNGGLPVAWGSIGRAAGGRLLLGTFAASAVKMTWHASVMLGSGLYALSGIAQGWQ